MKKIYKILSATMLGLMAAEAIAHGPPGPGAFIALLFFPIAIALPLLGFIYLIYRVLKTILKDSSKNKEK